MPRFDTLGRDFRFALRLMRQTPVVSAVAMLSLALGIGANVAIFNLVNALMLKALPLHEPERLVLLQFPSTDAGQPPRTSFTNPQWEYLRDHQDFLGGALAVGTTRVNLNAGGEARQVAGLLASGRFFDVLGVMPIIGRTFTAEDDRRKGGKDGPVVVLSHAFWQREYGGDRGVLGRAIYLDGHAFTIIGVAPPEFFGIEVGRTFDVAMPLGIEPILRGAESSLDQRSSWWLRMFARLAPGQTVEQANARLAAFHPSLREATMPQDWRPQDQKNYLAQPLTAGPGATGISGLRTRYSQPLYVLLGIVALVLLVACGNMANLLLAQSTARQREIAIRLSLGASRWVVARQLLIESMLLSFLGATAGVVLAFWGSRALVNLISTRTAIVTLDLAMDWRVLGFTMLVGMVTGLLFGVAPALRATGLTPAAALRDHSRGVVSGGGRFNLGHGLVALQVAISFVLVLGASLFVRTLVDLTLAEHGLRRKTRPDRERRSAAHQPHRQGAAGVLRAHSRRRGAGAWRRGCRGLGADPDEQQRLEQPDRRARLRRARTRPRRQLQSRHARLFQGDVDADPHRPRRLGHRFRRRAEDRPRQRGVRQEILQRSGSDRQDVHDRHRSPSDDAAGRRPRGRRQVRQPARTAAADDVCRLGADGDRVVCGARQRSRERRGQRASRDGPARHRGRSQGSRRGLQGVRRGRSCRR